jgi:hypothetical protein
MTLSQDGGIEITQIQSRVRVLFADIEHCVVGLLTKGSVYVLQTVWSVLYSTVQMLRKLYYEEVLQEKLFTAFGTSESFGTSGFGTSGLRDTSDSFGTSGTSTIQKTPDKDSFEINPECPLRPMKKYM